MPAPYDAETMETLIAVVKPMVEDAWPARLNAPRGRTPGPPSSGPGVSSATMRP